MRRYGMFFLFQFELFWLFKTPQLFQLRASIFTSIYLQFCNFKSVIAINIVIIKCSFEYTLTRLIHWYASRGSYTLIMVHSKYTSPASLFINVFCSANALRNFESLLKVLTPDAKRWWGLLTPKTRKSWIYRFSIMIGQQICGDPWLVGSHCTEAVWTCFRANCTSSSPSNVRLGCRSEATTATSYTNLSVNNRNSVRKISRTVIRWHKI